MDQVSFDVVEIKALAQLPEALFALAQWHDLQATMGEPMGYDCSWHNDRCTELKAAAAKIEKELEQS